MAHVSPARQHVMDVAAEFPNAATLTLAKKAYREHPELWPTFNACNLMFRKMRGQQGRRNRAVATDRDLYREASPCKGFDKLPEGIVHLEDWEPEEINVPGHWLVMSDTHVPYHHTGTIRAAWRESKKRKIRGILLNGDVADCFAVSRWEKDPRKRDFVYEMKTMAKFFEALRYAFPKLPIVWKAGNHDLRYSSYLMLKAPELLGIEALEFDRLTGAFDRGVKYIDDNRPVRLGKSLMVLHGHEYRFSISNPVNPARGLFLKAQVSAICGHFHQSSSHSEKNLNEHVTTCWSTGCMCDLRPDYSPLNKWNHGFAFVNIGQDGSFEVDNCRVLDGKVYR